jgi:hypothetical protein
VLPTFAPVALSAQLVEVRGPGPVGAGSEQSGRVSTPKGRAEAWQRRTHRCGESFPVPPSGSCGSVLSGCRGARCRGHHPPRNNCWPPMARDSAGLLVDSPRQRLEAVGRQGTRRQAQIAYDSPSSLSSGRARGPRFVDGCVTSRALLPKAFGGSSGTGPRRGSSDSWNEYDEQSITVPWVSNHTSVPLENLLPSNSCDPSSVHLRSLTPSSCRWLK